jgi:hypothetical protein
MLDPLMLQECVLSHVILPAYFNLAKITSLLLDTILAGHMLETHVSIECAAPVLPGEPTGRTALIRAIHGIRIRC